MRTKVLYFIMLPCLLTNIGKAQEMRTDLSSSEIRLELEKFGHLGHVLYLAAHPDDENTRLITYFDNGACLRTAYLSLTRGGGGQNLIGTEKGAELGLVRTQELLEARKIDRGEQYFSRAVDFGYSKDPEEAFEIWDKNKVLADVVRVIRQFRPDVIVTRFPPNDRAGHGHHTASAMLAEEAMKAAADKDFMIDELGDLPVHQVTRLYWNTSPWWFRDLPDRVAAGDEKIITVDVGGYHALLGQSFTEIAAESRSMHKSQGFGSSRDRGERLEYLEYMQGDMVTNGDLFQGIPRKWSDLKHGEQIQEMWSAICTGFDLLAPERSIPALVELRKKLIGSEARYRDMAFKIQELDRIILACAGIYAEAIAQTYSASPGETIEVNASAIKRSDAQVSVQIENMEGLQPADTLANNRVYNKTLKRMVPPHYSDPYWLRKGYRGVFQVEDELLIGRPETPPAMLVRFYFNIEGAPISLQVPVKYKWTDRVRGELYRPVHVLPAVTATYTEDTYIFTNDAPRMVEVLVKNHSNQAQEATVEPRYPKGWKVRPQRADVTLPAAGSEKRIQFEVTPDTRASQAYLSALVCVGVDTMTYAFREISHEHIGIQILLPRNEVKMVRIEVATVGDRIGYIMGAGDDVPAGLSQLGYEVVMLNETNISTVDLSAFQAVVAGVRAYNTLPWLKHQKDLLMEYVEAGGNYIVQYNTNRGVDAADMGPYAFTLSRDRVTDEYSEVEFLAPEHPIMTSPNEIVQDDFRDWVQERGLYYPNKWSEEYTALLRWADKGEDPKDGALIVAEYGEGAFIYTGISFFREIPAGVPGAFRLLANMVSYEPKRND